MILRKKIVLSDMEGVDADFHRNLEWTLNNDIDDVLDSTFSVEDDLFGKIVEIELKPGGSEIPVTNENKREYVELVTEWKIERRVDEQFKLFMSGFNELIPQELINVLMNANWNSWLVVFPILMLMTGRNILIIVATLKTTKLFNGSGSVLELGTPNKVASLQFTTGTSRIPVNGFKDLQGSDGPRRSQLKVWRARPAPQIAYLF